MYRTIFGIKNDLEATLKLIPHKQNFNEYTRDRTYITVFLPLVENIARKFSTTQQASGVMTINDLIQEGAIGLQPQLLIVLNGKKLTRIRRQRKNT